MSKAAGSSKNTGSSKKRKTPAAVSSVLLTIGGGVGPTRTDDAPWFRTGGKSAHGSWPSTSRSVEPAVATSIALLADRLGRLEQDVVETQKKFDAALRPREVELREIPRAQAKDEVMDFFLDHGRAYPSDAACALRLDALLVVELCDELQGEGLLGD